MSRPRCAPSPSSRHPWRIGRSDDLARGGDEPSDLGSIGFPHLRDGDQDSSERLRIRAELVEDASDDQPRAEASECLICRLFANHAPTMRRR